MQDRLKVLIIEDEFIIADSFSEFLTIKGHNVVGVVETGEEAIELALRERPDLSLVDITLMGEMDGIDVALKMREADAQMRIYMLSAYGADEFRDRLAHLENHTYMQKPVTLDDLGEILKDILN